MIAKDQVTKITPHELLLLFRYLCRSYSLCVVEIQGPWVNWKMDHRDTPSPLSFVPSPLHLQLSNTLSYVSFFVSFADKRI